MYLLFTDETNLTENINNGVKFFAYGGLIIPMDKSSELDKSIRILREQYGLTNLDSLKFDSNTRPSGLNPQQFAEIKGKIISLCVENDCKFLVYVVLHKIAEKQGINTTVKWGADHIVGKFNHYLTLRDSKGMVFVDRLSDVGEYKFLSEKFTKGLVFPNKVVALKNITLFSSTCDNASNFSSAMDIVLGTFRYCINRPFNETSAKTMMKEIVKLLWVDKNGEHLDPFEKGLTFRPIPEKITISTYKSEYEILLKHINTLLS